MLNCPIFKITGAKALIALVLLSIEAHYTSLTTAIVCNTHPMNCHKSRTNLKDKLRFLQEIYQVSLSLLYQNIGRVDRIKVVGVSGQVNDGGFECSNSEVDYIEIGGGG